MADTSISVFVAARHDAIRAALLSLLQAEADIAWLPALLESSPQSAFVVVGMHDHPAYVTRARQAGASDYVQLDDAEHLGSAVRDATATSA